MVTRFDHITIVVRDADKAKAFFALLGFVEQQSLVISGGQFASYMGIPDIEAQHVTLALANAAPASRFSSCGTASRSRFRMRPSPG